MAIYWLTPGFKGGTFKFSPDGTLISASAAPVCGAVVREAHTAGLPYLFVPTLFIYLLIYFRKRRQWELHGKKLVDLDEPTCRGSNPTRKTARGGISLYSHVHIQSSELPSLAVTFSCRFMAVKPCFTVVFDKCDYIEETKLSIYPPPQKKKKFIKFYATDQNEIQQSRVTLCGRWKIFRRQDSPRGRMCEQQIKLKPDSP